MDLTDFVLLIAFFVGSGLSGIVMGSYHYKPGFLLVGIIAVGSGILFAGIVYHLWLGYDFLIYLIDSRRKKRQNKQPEDTES